MYTTTRVWRATRATVSPSPSSSSTLLSSPQIPSSSKCPQTPELRMYFFVIYFALMLITIVKPTPPF
jgi:hypothetical protein